MAVLLDPLFSNPVGQDGETEPDAQEDEQVSLGEVVLEGVHGAGAWSAGLSYLHTISDSRASTLAKTVAVFNNLFVCVRQNLRG